jgi:hypothetical protein
MRDSINATSGPPLALVSGASELQQHLRLVMDKNKQRAVSILLLFGSILVVVAMWNLSEKPSPQVE